MFSPRYNTRQVIILYLGSKFQNNFKPFQQIIIHMSVVKVTDLFAWTEKTSFDSSQGPCYIAIFYFLKFLISAYQWINAQILKHAVHGELICLPEPTSGC